jgi:hypothetical protein
MLLTSVGGEFIRYLADGEVPAANGGRYAVKVAS